MSRELLAEEVVRRGQFSGAEDVRKLASLANAERQFGREYHGRFVIELLQNAADAWRRMAGPEERSRVRIILGDGPSLTVANQGEVLSAETIIKSLGHIGASTKPHGEAIGHKGIGFKSVLEMSLTPEVYSGFNDGNFDVAVRFDPERALSEICKQTDDWDAFLADVTGLSGDPLEPIPVLQFPFPMDAVPDEVMQLGIDGFTTIIRLAFDASHAHRIHLDADGWQTAARRALDEVTDEIVLLLDTFDEVILDDRIRGERVEITQSIEVAPRALDGGIHASQVVMHRNGELSSRWRLYRETLPDTPLLEGDIVVGIPLARDATRPYRIRDTVASAPFHLFFPTHIASGTPFLLHGYFEVAAGRASFYGGSEARNRSLLERLSGLVARAVDDAANTRVDMGPLAALLGNAGEAEDSLAHSFQAESKSALDKVAWVPTHLHPAVPTLVRPVEALAFLPESVSRRLSAAFDPGYVWAKAQAAAVDDALTGAALEYLAGRRSGNDPVLPDLWETMRSVSLPGEKAPWPAGSEDAGFVAYLELIGLLDATDRTKTQALISELRGNPAARVIPAVASDGARELVSPPRAPEPGRPGRSHLVLARLREPEAGELVPPAELRVSFIRDELLDARLLNGPASALGVQEYVVDNILDRIDGLASDEPAGPTIVDFMWRLLVREERSVFGLRRLLPEAASFEPARWFWFHPGRGEGTEADRQRRERGLASVALPTRAKTWVPASRVAFGEDWAEWLQSGVAGPLTAALRARAAAYRDLERLAPSPDRLLAPPELVKEVLPDIQLWDGGWPDDLLEEQRTNLVRHAFLLRLGVWEVLPVEAFVRRRDRADDRIPWPGTLRDHLLEWVAQRGGWIFPAYGSYEHENVTIGEDYRFDWPFDGLDPEVLARTISRASRLYDDLSNLFAFCPGCHTHKTRYTTDAGTQFPSRLALQLKTEPWLPCIKDGRDVAEPLPPAVAWWEPSLPERANIQQSPLRYLPVVRPATPLSESLRVLAELPQLATAGLGRISRLLGELRDGYRDGNIEPDPGATKLARQSFIGIHRSAYERLAEIAIGSSEQVLATVASTNVLCDMGDSLAYRPLNDVRHDDGKFAAYKRYFVGSIPFSVIAREREVVARRLGIRPFEVQFVRRDSGEGVDVTDEAASLLGDRTVDFLAIVVNHSLGTQTLDLGSAQFQERARRLQRLRVIRVDHLSLDAEVVGTEIRTSIGEQVGFDVFLDGPTSPEPVLYHDLTGDNWKESLRRKLGENVAAVLENPNYSATFTLYLQQETDAEREDFLLELGVMPDDLDAVRLALGVVSQVDRARRRTWFAAILDEAGAGFAAQGDELDEETALIAAGVPPETARRLVALGGGIEVRAGVGRDGALRLLAEAAISLERLHNALVARGDPGLVIRVASTELRVWKARYGRHVAAVLATKDSDQKAKAAVDGWNVDPGLKFALDPERIEVIRPVIADLQRVGLDPNPDALAGDDPIPELVRLAGCENAGDLDQRVNLVFDADERSRILRGLARDWRVQMRLIGVLVRATPHEQRSATRLHAEDVDRLLPPNPDLPTDLLPHIRALVAGAQGLTSALTGLLVDEVTASPPDRRFIGEILRDHGLEPGRLDEIERVLAMPARTEAKRLRGQMEDLVTHSVAVSPPSRRTRPPAPRPRGTAVPTIHVGGGEPRRRQLGDEGERWALAAIMTPLLDLSVRKEAIPRIVELLRTFSGPAVDRALAHADTVLAPDLDEDELIDELTALLHVARYSDAFGFDLLGWLPPGEGEDPVAMCIEAKSSGDGTFHLSASEWERAAGFRDRERGQNYAVLVIRRRRGPAPVPERLDLLVDPVSQCDQGILSRRDDGYVVAY